MRGWQRGVMVAALVVAIAAVSGGAAGSINYGYDPLGRLVTARYDNGLCIVYAYDANGNRTSQINSTASAAATWGSGTWGCFAWTAP